MKHLITNYRFVLFFLGGVFFHLVSCTPIYTIQKTEDETFRFSEKVRETDAVIDSIIDPYKTELDAMMNQDIGFIAESLTKEKPESTLGNWVADAIRNQAVSLGYEVDFASQNYGGLRIGELPKGNIQLGKIYELMPFENYLVILEIEGKELIKFFERISNYGGWPVSSEVNLVIEDDLPGSVEINGQAIKENRVYKIALPDYVANGGDNCSFFMDKKRINTGKLVRDLLVDEIELKTKNGIEISAIKEGRITLADK